MFVLFVRNASKIKKKRFEKEVLILIVLMFGRQDRPPIILTNERQLKGDESIACQMSLRSNVRQQFERIEEEGEEERKR